MRRFLADVNGLAKEYMEQFDHDRIVYPLLWATVWLLTFSLCLHLTGRCADRCAPIRELNAGDKAWTAIYRTHCRR